MQIYPMEADQIESIYTCTLHTSYPTSRTTRILINTFLNIPPLLLIAPVKNFDKVEEHVIYIYIEKNMRVISDTSFSIDDGSRLSIAKCKPSAMIGPI